MIIGRLTALFALACLACSGASRGNGTRNGKELSAMTTDLSRIDHVILGIGDLERGTAELERITGVRAVFGGAHLGRGTQNALISLGDHHYLEILAPNPAEAGNPDAASLSKLTALTPVGWAVRSDDLAALHESLRSRGARIEEIRPGGRNLPDGSRLDWKTLSFSPPSSPLLPFFIEWGRGGAHPSTTSPSGCRLTGFALEDPAPDAVREALAAAGLKVELRSGKESRIRVSLSCARGSVNF
jgi:catechol 2,3-dioxygenase-like lactoylglutathione lyase family enzyme